MAGAEGSAHSVEEARLGHLRLIGLADGKSCVGRLVPHGGVYDGSAQRKDGHFRGPLFVSGRLSLAGRVAEYKEVRAVSQ
jgi:hypothetical protein